MGWELGVLINRKIRKIAKRGFGCHRFLTHGSIREIS